jgi:hypothetical protein
MSNVVVTVAVVSQEFPAGTVAGSIVVSLVPKAGQTAPTPQTLPDAGTVTFANVAPGAWTASAVRDDGAGNAIGVAQTADFTVPTPLVAVNVPSTVSVVLQ